MQSVKVTTFSEYQAAAMRTCTPSSRNKAYMVTGLISEIGEVVGKYAKAIRDDNGEITEDRRKQIIAELGDVCWMVAGLFEVSGKVISDEGNEHFFDNLQQFHEHIKANARYNDNLEEKMLQLVFAAGAIAEGELTQGNTLDTAIDILFGVAVIADLLGANIQKVAQANIDKLTDRYNRNVIAGSGDNR